MHVTCLAKRWGKRITKRGYERRGRWVKGEKEEGRGRRERERRDERGKRRDEKQRAKGNGEQAPGKNIPLTNPAFCPWSSSTLSLPHISTLSQPSSFSSRNSSSRP
jgi:hypothetical protein